ncbi:MAG: STAS domain-containing protein [Candidatus Kariarchaeaceae archaeon]|jgi:anti-anti-sigma factor
MKDLERNYKNEVLVIEVDLFRASLADAEKFRNILDKEMANSFNNIIIDLSKCSFIDSSFIGALVVTLKKLKLIDGQLKLIITNKIIENAVHLSKTVNIFNTYYTLDEALNNKSSSKEEVDVKTERFSSVV